MWINAFFPFFQVTPSNNKKLARYENDLEFQNTFWRLFNLCLNSFEYEGLPSTCNFRYFETALILEGIATIVNDSRYGYLSLRCSRIPERYNMYGETDMIYGYGWTGEIGKYSAYMPGSDNFNAAAVICRDNYVTYPYINVILSYANRLTKAMRSIDVTSNKLKTPYFVVGDESQKKAIESVLKSIDENTDGIITNKSTSPNMFQVLPTRVEPHILTAQWEHYNNIEGQAKNILGIHNIVNQDKTERLLTDEVNGNFQSTMLNIDFRLKCREEFCKNIKDCFGLDIKVRLNSKLEEQDIEMIKNMDDSMEDENGDTD